MPESINVYIRILLASNKEHANSTPIELIFFWNPSFNVRMQFTILLYVKCAVSPQFQIQYETERILIDAR